MAIHVLAGGVNHNVGPVLEGTTEDGSGKGVVHDEGHSVGVGNICHPANVQYRQRRVCQRFAKHRLGVGLKGSVNFLIGGVGSHKDTLNAQLF